MADFTKNDPITDLGLIKIPRHFLETLKKGLSNGRSLFSQIFISIAAKVKENDSLRRFSMENI